MTNVKAYKKYSSAKKAAKGLPVVRIGGLYLVVTSEDIMFFGLASVEIIEPSGRIGGQVTLRHLDRLQNANYAVPRDSEKTNSRIFFKHEEKKDDPATNRSDDRPANPVTAT